MENHELRPPEIATSHPELKFSDLRSRGTLRFDQLVRGVDLQFTYDGRGALFQLFSNLQGSGRHTVLLPAFHCPTVVEPAIQAGFSPRFFRIGEDLTIDVDDFLRCLDNDTAAALVINYFGFPANIEELRSACLTNKTFLIEDCAHSFLSASPVSLAGDRADFAIFSFKKLVPSYVGGGIRCNLDESSITAKLTRPPTGGSIVNLKRMLDQAINQSDNRILNALQWGIDAANGFAKNRGNAQDIGPDNSTPNVGGDYSFEKQLANSRIPWLARHILSVASLDEVVAARQTNYEFLRSRLLAIDGVNEAVSSPIDSVCPWAFPISIDNRSTIDRQLKSLGVPLFTFGETLHSALFDDSVANDRTIQSAKHLSTQLLCLSIHQSISRNYLRFVASQVSHVMGNTPNTVSDSEN